MMRTETKAAANAAALGALVLGTPASLLREPNSDRMPQHAWCQR